VQSKQSQRSAITPYPALSYTNTPVPKILLTIKRNNASNSLNLHKAYKECALVSMFNDVPNPKRPSCTPECKVVYGEYVQAHITPFVNCVYRKRRAYVIRCVDVFTVETCSSSPRRSIESRGLVPAFVLGIRIRSRRMTEGRFLGKSA